MSYQAKLRALADYLDSHPKIAEKAQDYYAAPGVSIYCDNWEEFQDLIGHLGGYEKNRYGATLEAVHVVTDTDGDRLFKVDVNVSNVCVQTPKVDENGEPVMRKVRKYVETGEYEQEVEWSCPEVWSQK